MAKKNSVLSKGKGEICTIIGWKRVWLSIWLGEREKCGEWSKELKFWAYLGEKFLNGLQMGGGKWQNSWVNMLKCFKFSCTERKNNV